MLAAPQPRAFSEWSPQEFLTALERLLIAERMLDPNSLERGRRVAEESGGRLDVVLTRLGLLGERTLAETVARLLGLRLACAADYPRDAILPDRLRRKFLHKSRVVPIAIGKGAITIAMADPLDRFTVSAIAHAAGRAVEVAVAVPADLEAALDRLYPAENASGRAAAAELSVRPEGAYEDDAERLKDLAGEAPLIRLVHQLISHAVETNASDIHIDPFEDQLVIRYRYDGVLHPAEAPPRRLQPAVVSRIKIMAQLDIAQRRLPQDGRIKLVVRGRDVDLRVSTVPSLHGESVSLRILDRSAVSLDFAKLGIAGDVRERLRRLLGLPNGIVLVTGPTGSGKTTTLYTALRDLNSTDRNIITAEDPVEYRLPGITQIQVKPQIGLTFAALLRAILRHDPDVIMVGEIRDAETAQIAVQAALTGHLVLSTAHTNSACATVTRLRDMGIEDYLLVATVSGIVAQRLLRRLCPACKQPGELPAELIGRFGFDRVGVAQPVTVYEPSGCPACRNTGYTGRIAVAELLTPDDCIRRLILVRAGHAEIQDVACNSGMRTMYEDGLLRVADGTTSLGEVLRSVRLEG